MVSHDASFQRIECIVCMTRNIWQYISSTPQCSACAPMFGEVGMLGGGIGVEGLPVYHVELLQGNTVSL